MENRLENCLRSHRINTNSLKLINDLACILIDNCSTEIDSAIQRFLLRSRSISHTSSGIHIQTPRNDSNYIQHRLRSIVDAIIFEPGFKSLRSRFFKVCLRFHPLLSRSSSSDLRYVSNSTSSEETVLGLSNFSFGYSLRPSTINELNIHLNNVIDPNIDIKLKLQSFDSLLAVSPITLTVNIDLSPLIDDMERILFEPKLFVHTMQLLSRLLQIKDEQLWSKIIKKLALYSKNLLNLNSITTISKLQFIDFVLQLIGDTLNIYRHFLLDIQISIMKSFALLLEVSEFVRYSISIDPSASWLVPRLRCFSHRRIISYVLISIISNYINEEIPTLNYQVQCFQFCLLIQAIQYKDLLAQLDPLKTSSYLRQLFILVLKKKRFRRTCSLLLLETSMVQTSATFFALYLIDLLGKLKQSLSIKICANIVKNSTLFTNYPHTLIKIINDALLSQNPSTLQLIIDVLDILAQKNWLHFVRDGVDNDKLIQRLDPKLSAQHARIMLALGTTKNQHIWTHSFKYFIRSPWLSYIQHPIKVTTIEEKHYINRLITKFLTIEENRSEEIDNKWELSPLFWMIITQPELMDNLIDPFNLNLQLNEQFNKLEYNQQSEFLQRMSMLVSNLNILTLLRRHFQLANKLSQIIEISNDDKLIVDKRFIMLGEVSKHWHIAGPNERCQSELLYKLNDLRLLINRPTFKRQYEFRAPSIDFNMLNKSTWLRQYLECDRDEDYSTFINKFIESLKSIKNESLNFTSIVSEEWLNLIIEYGFGIGLITNKKTIRSVLSILTLPECVNERNHWFLALILLISRFDPKQTIRLINSVLASKNLEIIWPKKNVNSTDFFEMIKIEVMPFVERSIRPLTLQRLRHSNVPIFHLLLHYSYRNYLGLLDFSQLLDYFVLQLIFGPKFQAFKCKNLFSHLILEHLCAEYTLNTAIPLRYFFHPDLSNLSLNTFTTNIELLFDK